MSSTVFTDIILPVLGSSTVSSILTYVVARRKRKNDFLSELQKSIDLLSEKYGAVLRENILLKEDNAKLLASQKEMSTKIDTLNKKIDKLQKLIKGKTDENID